MDRIGHVAAQHLDAAGTDPTRPSDQGQQRGFAYAIRPDQATMQPPGMSSSTCESAGFLP
jgi:hypothetical protein